MQNEENTVETQDEITEGQSADQAVENDESSDTSEKTPEQVKLEAELAHAKAEAAKYRRLHEKSQKQPEKKATVQPDIVDIDERVLRANGMSNEVLNALKDVAKLRGLSLIDAQADPLFQAEKKRVEDEIRSKKAQLGVSRGGNKTVPKKEITTPGLSREEHMEMVKNLNG